MILVSNAKRTAHRVLDWRTAKLAPRRFAGLQGSLVVLSYHRILPREFSETAIVEPGMFVYEDTFRCHMELLTKHFEPIELADWLEKRADGASLPERAAAVTFDDGWRDNYRYAFPVLKELGISATIFVVSRLAGSKRSFWPERLARRLIATAASGDAVSAWLVNIIQDAGVNVSALSPETISRVIAKAKRHSDQTIHEELDKLDAELGAVASADGPDLADWVELREMVDSGLIAIGSHTRNHVRMHDDLSAETLREEVTGSRDDIAKHCGQPAKLFCFPNGDRTVAADALVRQTYLGACTTQSGWNSVDTDAHAIQRVSLHEDRSASDNAFLARLVNAM